MPATTSANPIPEFLPELQVTRRLLERVPGDRGDWRPHPRSFPLAHLAQLVAVMPGWVVPMVRESRIDLAAQEGYATRPTAQLLETFDAGVREGAAALEALTPAQLGEPWSLVAGERVLSTDPRGEVLRMHVRHMVHHRAQLGVYLRMLDVPVPSMYGPTADEKWGG